MKIFKVLTLVMLLVAVASALTNTGLFYNATLSAYYFFMLVSIVCIGFAGGFLASQKAIRITVNPTVSCFCLWVLYIVLNGIIRGKINLTHYYFTVGFLFFLSIGVFLSIAAFEIKWLFKVITGLAFIESCVCILQYLGWISSQNNLFPVTGTWINPNVTAMFLAMAVPPALLPFIQTPQKNVKINSVILIILLIALVLLKCRTAFIGGFISSLIQFNQRYQLLHKFPNQKNRSGSILLLVIGIGVLFQISGLLYRAKQASADGRKLIWKLSAIMVKEKPLLGYGYGTFEKHYNEVQANYVKEGKASVKELERAGPVHMAYNEILQNAVEGGIIGAFLFIATLGSLLIIPYKNKGIKQNTLLDKSGVAASSIILQVNAQHGIVCYSALVSFACMSVMNFTVQAIPVFCMFLIYGAVLTPFVAPSISINKVGTKKYLQSVYLKNSFFPAVTLIGLAIYLGISIGSIAFADAQNKKAYNLSQKGLNNQALILVSALKEKLGNDDNFWKNYASIQINLQHYSAAITTLQAAKKLNSSPEIFALTGYCYFQLNNYVKAATEYEQAVLLNPSKFSYRHALMMAYLKSGKKERAFTAAKEIISLKPKLSSAKVIQYKNAARQVLHQYTSLTNKSIPIKNYVAY